MKPNQTPPNQTQTRRDHAPPRGDLAAVGDARRDSPIHHRASPRRDDARERRKGARIVDRESRRTRDATDARDATRRDGAGRAIDVRTRIDGRRERREETPTKRAMAPNDGERTAFALKIARGRVVEVTKTNGETIEGVFAETTKNGGEATIKYGWTKREAGAKERAQRSKPMETMAIAMDEIASITARDVGMSDLAVGPSRMNDDFTDGGISRGATGQDRELVAWAPEEGDGASGMTLEEEAGIGAKKAAAAAWGKKSGGQWDQFSANKQLFGVDTKFDESLYTTTIDKTKGGISEAEAARIAYEIQNQISDNPHVAEERGQKALADYDEEERYSSVLPTPKGAAPPTPAWGSGKVPSTVAQHAEKKPAGEKAKDVAQPADASKSKLNANAKSFSLSAKAAEFVPTFKKPAAPQVPPTGPQMMMYPGYPQMQGQMMYMPQMGMGVPPQMRGMMPGMPYMPQQGMGVPHGAPPTRPPEGEN